MYQFINYWQLLVFQKPVRGHLQHGHNAVVSGSPSSFKRENRYGTEQACNFSFIPLHSLYQLELSKVMQTVIYPIQCSHLALLIAWMRRDTNLWSCWPTLITIEVVKNMSSHIEKLYLGTDEHPLYLNEFQYHIQKDRNGAALCPETTHQEKSNWWPSHLSEWTTRVTEGAAGICWRLYFPN